MKALLNLKNGKNDTIPVLLEIDQKTQNPRPLVNVSCSDCFYRGEEGLLRDEQEKGKRGELELLQPKVLVQSHTAHSPLLSDSAPASPSALSYTLLGL